MTPQPVTIRPDYRGSGKLEGKVAIVTGGGSGIGRAVAVHFAAEGADVTIAYLDEGDDASETKRLVEGYGRRCETFAGDFAVIVNTTSVTEYKEVPELLDYSATKGAIVGFTRSLSQALAERKIRVNAVAPSPVWTPLTPSTFLPEEVATFGADVSMKRAGEPAEIATCYVFLASEDSRYMSGQLLHPNGGEVVNG